MIDVYEGAAANEFLTALTEPRNADDSIESEAKQKVEQVVKQLIETVRTKGDRGIVEIAIQLKDIKAGINEVESSSSSSSAAAAAAATPVSIRGKNRFALSENAIAAAVNQVDKANRVTIELAASRIREFGSAVVNSIKSVEVDCGEFQTGIEHRPVRRVACYVPAGR